MERPIVQLKYRVHEGDKAGHIFFYVRVCYIVLSVLNSKLRSLHDIFCQWLLSRCINNNLGTFCRNKEYCMKEKEGETGSKKTS